MKNKIFGILLLILALFAFSCKTESDDGDEPVAVQKTPEVKAGTYTVNHYQQNVTGDEYTLFESEQISGKAGEKTQATAKTYEHFTAKDFSQTTISADGSTTVRIDYDREIITLTFAANGGTWGDGTTGEKTISGRYGTTVSFEEFPRKTGYGTAWDKELQTTFTSNETYTAQYEAGVVNYKVEHYKQSLEDDGYPDEPSESELKTGSAGAETAAEAKEYEEFESPTVSQNAIAADGNTTIKIYYERKKYTVSFYTEEEGTLESSEHVKHGAKVIAPTDPTKTGYDFKGWFASSDNGTTLSQTAFDFETAITDDVALYAKWELKTISYTVKHLWQNLENDNYTENEIETLSGKFGEQTRQQARLIQDLQLKLSLSRQLQKILRLSLRFDITEMYIR